MNIKGKTIDLILGDIRARHTGKDPFGVASDLRDLMLEIEPEQTSQLEAKLQELSADPFWGDFVRLAQKMKTQ